MSHATASANRLPADPQKELQQRLDRLPYVPTRGIRREIGEQVAQDYSIALDSVNEEYERRHGLAYCQPRSKAVMNEEIQQEIADWQAKGYETFDTTGNGVQMVHAQTRKERGMFAAPIVVIWQNAGGPVNVETC